MLFLVLFTTALLAAAAFAAWPALGGPQKETDAESGADGAGGGVAMPTTLEGALTVQLMSGEINRTQYQRALERLAARDDEQHPLSVPEKGDSSAGT